MEGAMVALLEQQLQWRQQNLRLVEQFHQQNMRRMEQLGIMYTQALELLREGVEEEEEVSTDVCCAEPQPSTDAFQVFDESPEENSGLYEQEESSQDAKTGVCMAKELHTLAKHSMVLDLTSWLTEQATAVLEQKADPMSPEMPGNGWLQWIVEGCSGQKCGLHGWREANGFCPLVFDPGKSGAEQGIPKLMSSAFIYTWLGEIVVASKLFVVRFVFKPGEKILRYRTEEGPSLNPPKKYFEGPTVIVSGFLEEKPWWQRFSDQEKIDGDSGSSSLGAVYLCDGYTAMFSKDPLEVFVKEKNGDTLLSYENHGWKWATSFSFVFDPGEKLVATSGLRCATNSQVCTHYVCSIVGFRRDLKVEDRQPILEPIEKLWSQSFVSHAVSPNNLPSSSVSIYGHLRGNTCLRPDTFTYAFAMSALGSLGQEKIGMLLHAHLIIDGFGDDLLVGSAIVDMYLNSSKIGFAYKVFARMPQRDTVLWNTMVSGLVKNCCYIDSVEVLGEMLKYVYERDEYVFGCLLDALCKNGSVKETASLFDDIRMRCTPTLKHFTSWLYQWCREVARKMADAYGLLQELRRKGCEPNAASYTVLTQELCVMEKTKECMRVFADMERWGCAADVMTYNALVSGLCKCRNIDWAYELLNIVPKRGLRLDQTTYLHILLAHAKREQSEKCLQLVEKMNEVSCFPDTKMYITLTRLACELGEVDEGIRPWNEMEASRLSPGVDSHTILVDGPAEQGYHFKEVVLSLVKDVWGCIFTKGCELNVYAWTIWIHALFAKLMKDLRKLYNRQIAAESTEKIRKMPGRTIMFPCVGVVLRTSTASYMRLPIRRWYTLCATSGFLLLSGLTELACMEQGDTRPSIGHTDQQHQSPAAAYPSPAAVGRLISTQEGQWLLLTLPLGLGCCAILCLVGWISEYQSPSEYAEEFYNKNLDSEP